MAAGEVDASAGLAGQLDPPGPFRPRQARRINQLLRMADRSTGLAFSVYLGDLAEPARARARELHAQLPDPPRSVLLAVSPNQRMLEIVTGAVARRQLPDRDCQLAALAMSVTFAGGDLTGGIVIGLAQLAAHAAH